MMRVSSLMRAFSTFKMERMMKSQAAGERIKELTELTSRLKGRADLDQADVLEATILLTEGLGAKGFSKLANVREAELYDVVAGALMKANNHAELVRLLSVGAGRYQRKPTVGRMEEHLTTHSGALSPYQKCFAAFWFGFYQHRKFVDSCRTSIEPEVHTLTDFTRENAAILFSYAQLILHPIAEPSREFALFGLLPKEPLTTLSKDVFQRQARELQLYLSPQATPLEKDLSSDIKVRSQLETEVQCALSALRIPFQRQVELLGCYVVDFKCGKQIIQVLGPSHYLQWKQLKGPDVVRKKVLEKHGLKYLIVNHTDWSKLKGIRNQLEFMNKLLM